MTKNQLTKLPIKQSFKVLISVDEQKFRLQRHGLNDYFSLKEAIQNEFGWLYESGIYLDKIYKHKK